MTSFMRFGKQLSGLAVILALGGAAEAAGPVPSAGPAPTAQQPPAPLRNDGKPEGAILPTPAAGRNDLPINAIGLVRMDNAICTGAVVGPRLVLTAAHCMFPGNQPARSISFHAGFDNGREVVVAQGIDRIVAPGYRRGNSGGRPRGDDWALVVLDRDIGAQTGILGVRGLNTREIDDMIAGRGPVITQIGYGHGGGRRMFVIENCRLYIRWDAAAYGHNCGTIQGDSGSPNLIRENGRWVVTGLESADVDTEAMPGVDMVVSASMFERAVRDAQDRRGPATPPPGEAKPPVGQTPGRK